jgi:hypothetical protein
MIRIIGNSTERVRIPDLGDTVYYRQVKEYTDQEYESSKDLQRAVSSGRLAKIAVQVASRGSIPEGQVVSGAPAVSERDIRRIVREETSLKDAIPSIVTMLRQEISDLIRQNPAPVQTQQPVPEREFSKFNDPTFAPKVSTEGMTANIKLDSREANTGDVSSALAALRKLQNPNPSST